MKEIITHQMVADKLAAYLQHDLSLANLVAWAESAMMEGEFEPQHFTAIRDVVARLAVAGVWFVWSVWSIESFWFIWFDERERAARPAHQIGKQKRAMTETGLRVPPA